MTKHLRHLLLAMVALALIAALVFLYDKTQAVDLRERNDIAALLDTLREIDGRWDIDVLRARTELDPNQPPAPDRTATAKKALANLAAAVPQADSAALREGLGELAKAIIEKAALVEKYKAESARAKIALNTVFSGAAALGELLPLRRIPLIAGEMGVNLLVEVDGTVKSWGAPQGDGTYLGDGTEGSRKEPEPIPGMHDIVDAAVAPGHALVLTRGGTVLTWGRNRSCELTVTDDHKRLTPFPVKGVRNAVQVAAGPMFSAAVLRDGTVWGWGPNRNGELCDGSTEKRNRPVQMKNIANAVDIDLGTNSTIVLADGSVWSCGLNTHAELARKPEPESVKHSTPVRIEGISNAVAARSNMVRLKDGTLRGWGSGIFGALGNGKIDGTFPKPSAPIGLGPVIEHYWASNSAYAIKADGTVMAWAFYVGGPKEWQLTPVAWRTVKLAD